MLATRTISDYELLQHFKSYLLEHRQQVKQYDSVKEYVEKEQPTMTPFTNVQARIPKHYKRVIRQLTAQDFVQIEQQLKH
ncbi:hypothetical protein [Loigolactobacillus zhaoyuanensis]|uniref:Uncharacterized protein n=1 Tax=Loigolactobacillus zhaoyuanensis TaxID=2486017 RepID=A0ABW8UJE3_9LACO|nr:hypothetical protein [Loigolactobacillus zhaoyuanensis]